jgi:very-short-patch-repair endonuclease
MSKPTATCPKPKPPHPQPFSPAKPGEKGARLVFLSKRFRSPFQIKIKTPMPKRNPEATQFARNQRATANEFAQDVWQMVRSRRCCGEKFRREYVIEPYTVDFCCIALKLIIEIDGKDHFTEQGREHDRVRDKYLNERGYEVLRIPGYEVLKEPQQVLMKISSAIEARRGS